MLVGKPVRNLILFIGVLMLCPDINAQERCGTVQYVNLLKKKGLVPQDDSAFELWLDKKLKSNHKLKTGRANATYTIPVVVHVIHNGEAIGTGANISDAQINSQMRVLNEDFRRLNADASNTPPEFLSVAGSLDIEFVLAKRNPEGLATNGINRVQGPKSLWTVNDNYQLKSLSYWPAEDYLNIWVCNLSVYLGYTQFPESTLQGLEGASTNRLTDGLVIWYRVFGSSADGNFGLDPSYDKGRTTTHELGHFFGLRHIWGDDGSSCTGSDYVNDTPNQGARTLGCPAHPRTSCSATSMFQNFMDYTDDNCMNLFTTGQVNRMITVLENSPRRKSLTTSPGVLPPAPVANDLGVRSSITPTAISCNTTFSPAAEIRNYGSNTVNSVRLRYSIDGALQNTSDFAVNLSPLDITQVTFPSKTLTPGTYTFTFEILLVNGTTDPVLQNNLLTLEVLIPEFQSPPIAENLNTLPPKWRILNPDDQFTWQLATAPNESPGNSALTMNFFDYEDNLGELDFFISPIIDLSTVPVASLVFEVAYARYQTSADGLKVIILRDCEDIDDGTVVYDKEGASLATTASTTSAFVPSSTADWRREQISLTQFVGENHVQIAFVGINDWGNNLYLDNIAIVTSELEDLSVVALPSPSPVSCENSSSPLVTIQNLGNVNVTSFNLSYSINDGAITTIGVTGVQVAPGGQVNYQLPVISLPEGSSKISVEVKDPNGVTDETPENNERDFKVVVNKSTARIPLREDFNDGLGNWSTVNPAFGMEWQSIEINSDVSFYFNAFDNTAVGEKAWLVSPTLDFTASTTASMVFDYSYRRRTDRMDELRIRVSTDCGASYEELTPTFSGPIDSQEWTPQEPDDWARNTVVDLTKYAGEPEVRIAFVIENDNGNNFYLDNVEFFTTDNPTLVDVNGQFSIYGYDTNDFSASRLLITFNLPEKMDVHYSIADMLGRKFASGTLRDVLNQTWPLDAEDNLAAGVYVVKVQIGEKTYQERILVGR